MSSSLENARWLADQIVAWQSASGGIDVRKCVYHAHTPLGKPSAYGQDIPWLARALYRAYDATLDSRYKDAADRYSVYFIATMYSSAPTFALGDALDPCLSEYRRHNPHEDSLDDKARTLRDWILGNRTENGNYFDVGYCWQDEAGEYIQGSDAAFSNDLSDVGRGLLFYGSFFDDKETLGHAVELARYFTREHVPGTLEGVWSSPLGTWVIGPRPAKGFENVKEFSDAAGWGWTSYYASHYLMRLHDVIDDDELKARIKDCCVSSMRWAFDACQFEDGALGMSGRDDKWLGMTGLAILLHRELRAKGWLAGETAREYGPKVSRAFEWLLSRSGPETFPADGYVAVTGATRPEPAWNTSWMIAIVLEALLVGADVRSAVEPVPAGGRDGL